MGVLRLAKLLLQNHLLQMIPVLTLAPSISLAENGPGIVVPVVLGASAAAGVTPGCGLAAH